MEPEYDEGGNLIIPDPLTAEFINSITRYEIFKDLVNAKNWGGKKGKFMLRDIKNKTLPLCKIKAIEILRKENIEAQYRTQLEKSIATGKHVQDQNGEDYIQDEKGFFINIKKEYVLIPLKNSKNELIKYAITSTEDFEEISKLTFHSKVDKRGSERVISNLTPLTTILLGNIPKGYNVRFINYNPLDLRRENMLIVTTAQFKQSHPKKKGKYECDYRGVSLISKHKKVSNSNSENEDDESIIDDDESFIEENDDLNENNLEEEQDNINKYRVSIKFENKKIRIGHFKNEQDAAKAYDIYAYHYYREYCGNNGMLTKEEIKDVLVNGIPKDYQKVKPERDLPTNLYRGRGKKSYSFDFSLGGHRYYLNVGEDLERAILKMEYIREKLIENYKQELEEKNQDTPILRNSDGIPILQLINMEGETIGEAKVSEEIWRDLNKHTWHLKNTDYPAGFIDNKNIELHNHIYNTYMVEKDKRKEPTIDHINRDKLDARIENLREASRSLQSHNRDKSENAIIKDVKGVTINGNKFVVNPYKVRYSFDFLEDAAIKFNELAIEKYGKEANLNIIGEGQTRVIDLINIEDITEEYIDNIQHVELFKLVAKKKNWGGKDGELKPSYVKASTLEDAKTKAKLLLRQGK